MALFPGCTAALLAIMFALAPTRTLAQQDANYLNSAALLQRALDALFAEIGSVPRIAAITIGADTVTVHVQGAKAAHHTEEWQANRSRWRWLWYDTDRIHGPTPVQGDGIVAETELSFFDYSTLAIADLEAIVARSIKAAKMEDWPTVSAIEIRRAIRLLPRPSYGNVRWTISLTTGHETATVYTDPSGQIIGSDLSNTFRAKRLNLIAQDDWPMGEAQQALASVVGADTAIVHQMTINESYLYIEVDHPTKVKTKTSYSWNYSGVRRDIIDTPDFSEFFSGTARFTLSELDLTALPKIKAAAREAFGNPSARILFLRARKATDRPTPPAVLWQVKLWQSNGEDGEVLLSTTGEVIEVELPPSRRPVEDWLTPPVLSRTLQRLEKEFGPNARFSEILVDNERARVTVVDPHDPGAMAEFIINASGLRRFGTPIMPWEKTPDPARLFTLADIAAVDETRMSAWNQRVLGMVSLDGAAVYRWTIQRRMTPRVNSPILAVEIRAGLNDGWTAGWIVFDLDGAEHEVMTP